MKMQDKVAIVCCSNGLPIKAETILEQLVNILNNMGLMPVLSEYIFIKDMVFNGNGEQRAKALMDFYQDKDIKAIFDISGGDVANEILPYLDYEIIKANNKPFYGYSDLTTLINAIYTMTGNSSVLYQVRNLVGVDMSRQQDDFYNTLFNQKNSLYDFTYEFIQGNSMQGIIVGGNIRCLLKLAGTNYWPDMNKKILILESRSGNIATMTTYFSQLKQIGVFEKINGLILGTFSELESQVSFDIIIELVQQYVRVDLPIIKTDKIGHGFDSKAIKIGEFREFSTR